MINKKLTGFALIELLVAISIFSIVITVVYTTLFISLKTYHRTQRELRLTQDINKVLDKLSMELRNCYDAEYKEQEDKGGFIADAQRVSFFTIQNVYSQGSFEKTLARISYSFSDGKLLKKTQRDKEAFLDESDFKEEELISGVQSFKIEYLYFKKAFFQEDYKYEWKSEWVDKSQIPQGIRIEIVKLDPKYNINAAYKRYIFIQQGEVGVQDLL
ncbi:type II secretion system protein J [Candidatus Omnitrophota bacterium]